MYLDPAKTQLRYQALVEALRPFTLCWNQSVIQDWPVCRDVLPGEWLESLREIPLDALHAIDICLASGGTSGDAQVKGLLPASLQSLLATLQSLLQVDEASIPELLPAERCLRMTEKKQQEIAAILPFIRDRIKDHDLQRAVDIGGGAGHLARSIVSELSLPMVSIDRDEALQTLGRSLLDKQRMQEGREGLRFVSGEVLHHPQQDLDPHFEGSCLSLGLHTCGPLALAHLYKSQTSRCLLNFGCCYDRMQAERDCQVSRFAKEHPLHWTSYALFLATRGRMRSLPELAMQETVNSFRLALHLFLQAEGLSDGFITVGDAPKSAYSLSFAEYAENRFHALGFANRFSRSRALAFVQEKSVQKAMREFFLVNVLRNVFARPLELLILLDRVILLMEQGRTVSLLQFFDQKVSPRNLGIFADFPSATI